MPRQNSVFSDSSALQIVNVMKEHPLTNPELMSLARKFGVKVPYERLVLEGLEAKGWLIYVDSDEKGRNCRYGVMDFHNGRSETNLCSVM